MAMATFPQTIYTTQRFFNDYGTDDIRKKKFHQFQFFRIWFILQRFDRFGFRPFLTNLEATVELEGNC